MYFIEDSAVSLETINALVSPYLAQQAEPMLGSSIFAGDSTAQRIINVSNWVIATNDNNGPA